MVWGVRRFLPWNLSFHPFSRLALRAAVSLWFADLSGVSVQEVRESRRVQEQRIVEVDSGVRRDYEFKLAQALQVRDFRVAQALQVPEMVHQTLRP